MGGMFPLYKVSFLHNKVSILDNMNDFSRVGYTGYHDVDSELSLV